MQRPVTRDGVGRRPLECGGRRQDRPGRDSTMRGGQPAWVMYGVHLGLFYLHCASDFG